MTPPAVLRIAFTIERNAQNTTRAPYLDLCTGVLRRACDECGAGHRTRHGTRVYRIGPALPRHPLLGLPYGRKGRRPTRFAPVLIRRRGREGFRQVESRPRQARRSPDAAPAGEAAR